MARVKTAIVTRKKHKKVLKRAKGYYGAKHYRFRQAKQAVMKSGAYAYVGRKDRKGLKKAEININRKMLAELAVNDAKAFTELCNKAKAAK